ncbi:hypothetical protein [Staphylococcus aureus]|uniref:hypothetical protein n=1 Tax=Staphylococcus aureus TaxID=1280 RepID=UPI000DE4E068|nr:hypothetical protein [Staphylococcus aureus]
MNRNYRSNKDNVVTVDANGYIYFENALEQSETFSVILSKGINENTVGDWLCAFVEGVHVSATSYLDTPLKVAFKRSNTSQYIYALESDRKIGHLVLAHGALVD